MKSKKIVWSIVGIIVVLTFFTCMMQENEKENFRLVKNEKEYSKMIEEGLSSSKSKFKHVMFNILTLPASALEGSYYYDYDYNYDYGFKGGVMIESAVDGAMFDTVTNSAASSLGASSKGQSASQETGGTRDYSTTNIQVKNVDEADRIKTDGEYIYTINNESVNVINANDINNPVYTKKIITQNDSYPEDIFITDDKLIIIGRASSSNATSTFIEVHEKKDDYKLLKSYTIEGSYYTSRIIDNRLVLTTESRIKSGVMPLYKIGDSILEVDFNKMYINNRFYDRSVVFVGSLNLNDLENLNVYGVASSVDNMYVSEDHVYLINTYYGNGERDYSDILGILGPKGIFGIDDIDLYDYSQRTKILKLKLEENNEIKLTKHTDLEGKTLNQFSFDEKDGYLRMAMDSTGDDENASSVVILDENLKEVGRVENIAAGERIYSARFIGDKLYLVTYKTMDPLFVIDLSDVKNPKVLGELKIPGYSIYLHPYDENHIIGIGVETKENIRYDAFGRVISESSQTLGLKMAIFDVSDVSSPKEISNVIIGNSRTTSNILSNHKALLFSKEKEIIAIPISQMKGTSEINYSYNAENINSIINAYNNNSKGEVTNNGFAVYNINLEDGITLKGNVYHENVKNSWYSYSNIPVRGLYIEDNLFTVSDDYIKVNNINTLEEIAKVNMEQ